MTFDQALIFIVLGLSLCLFAWGRLRFDIVALLALLTITIAGLVSAREAFAGFGHPAVITVAAVLLISHAIGRSGLIESLGDRVASIAKKPVSYLTLMCGSVGTASAFMNNVGALALILPIAIKSSLAIGRPLSRTLMPLSFASLLGGLTTLIGTPPNIIIATQREQITGTPFQMFDFTPVGFGVACGGIAFVALIGWRLLPDRSHEHNSDEQPFDLDDYIAEIEASATSLSGNQDAGDHPEGADRTVRVLGKRRLKKNQTVAETQSSKAEEVLIVEASPHQLLDLIRKGNVNIRTRDVNRQATEGDQRAVVEAVIAPGSLLEGRRPDSAVLRHLYQVDLLGVSRQGRTGHGGFPNMTLEVGNVLLLEGNKHTLRDDLSRIGCLPLATRDLPSVEKAPSAVPLALFAGGIGLAAFGIVPVHVSFVAVAVLMVLCQCLTLRELYEKIDWPVIVLLGAFLPIGQALMQTGATEMISNTVLSVAGAVPLYVILAATIAVSMLLSDLINNGAAAIVMAPIGASLAEGLGVNTDAFLMAAAIGCTCTFLTPIGHQSNALVFGPGGYRFGDYWRMGLPLGMIVVAVATPLINIVWVH